MSEELCFCVVLRPGCRSSCLCRPLWFHLFTEFRRSVLPIFSGAEEVMPAAQYKDTNAAFANFSSLLTFAILMARRKDVMLTCSAIRSLLNYFLPQCRLIRCRCCLAIEA